MTLVDQDNRWRAMTDFASILLVVAAAGTGKTSLMAGRVAMMLAAGHHPGEITAITFTELAASQLAARINETVDVLLAGEVPAFLKAVIPLGLSELQRSALVTASTQLDELTATTIHGFCQAIIRSHGVEAGLDPGARIRASAVRSGQGRVEPAHWPHREHALCSLSGSLDQLLESYRARKRAAAILDFDDLIVHVQSLVRSHEEVRQAVGRRYRYILVDEFQDMDRIQSEILFSIAATAERPTHWEAARLRAGALFLVGDPKQAIYRFRGADIEAYELCSRLIQGQNGGAVIEVTANFRSLSPIIHHVNACFEPVFAKPSQPRYVALAPTLSDVSQPLPCVARSTIEIPTAERIYAEMFREAEAERVADICAALIGNLPILRADNTHTPLKAGDIALLSPGHTELWRYERALEQRGLAVSSQAGQTLMRRQETQDVLALVRVLAVNRRSTGALTHIR
ncbi:UvrD-helicase domain-containing protein [Bradyrhizobium sp. 173]|uniref:UvrD-helicase domain-containing protein n=1 Tax=Bradyrhizobium sp. 173 TaxID=2782644 RepID=UPI001FF8B148|nr:UvrD-helicase domain-containing protein [Bradyrhizobium sp. 173]MCK1568811.1 UvrD-helicase domain-containing protein [Bradyrhizobium sp. 173]